MGPLLLGGGCEGLPWSQGAKRMGGYREGGDREMYLSKAAALPAGVGPSLRLGIGAGQMRIQVAPNLQGVVGGPQLQAV